MVDVFRAMENSTEPVPDTKDSAAVKKYFETVFPDMDFERVYSSDTKKMIKWYQMLKGKVSFQIPEEQAEEASVENEEAEQPEETEGQR